MTGSHSISVQNNKVKYEFLVKRNITVIQGNSATGKTTLVDLIREYQQVGSESGINLSCDKKCVVLEGNDWLSTLGNFKDSIVFIDEGNRFISSVDFASAIKRTDNYYVIVTREGLENLPYSVDEIYGIHTSGKYQNLKQVYHEFYHIYTDNSIENNFQKVITEDSNSGHEFFSVAFEKECIAANGKSNIYQLLVDSKPEEKILVIADGAAFGSQMNQIMLLSERKKNFSLFLPESFEWLILQSDIVNAPSIKKILENPENFIDSSKYFSWEQFFTAFLIESTDGTYLKYSKKKLNQNFLEESIKSKILKSEAMKGINDKR